MSDEPFKKKDQGAYAQAAGVWIRQQSPGRGEYT